MLIDTSTIKRLFVLYESGTTKLDPNDILLFFNIFTTFINFNEEARKVIEQQELCVLIFVKEAGPFLIYKDDDDGLVKWSKNIANAQASILQELL